AYVVDVGNNRVLEYDNPKAGGGGTPGTPGSAGDVTADLVFGQSDFNSNTCNLSPDASTLCLPGGGAVAAVGSGFTTDTTSNRVLGYAEPSNPPTNSVAALEFGQGTSGLDFTDHAANAGGLSASSLALGSTSKGALAIDIGSNLFVGDTLNYRVLAFD